MNRVARAYRRRRLGVVLAPESTPCARPLVAGLLVAALTAGGFAAPAAVNRLGLEATVSGKPTPP